MHIQIIWPERQKPVTLHEHHCQETPLWCSALTGQFSEQPAEHAEAVAFWLQQQMMMSSNTQDFICLLDGQPLAQGEIRPLRSGMRVQLGHFLLEAIEPDTDELITSLLPVEGELPELELLINHGGHYIPYAENAKQHASLNNEDDPLKSLTQEYKHYLLWGEQPIPRRNPSSRNEPVRERFNDSNNFNASLKNKTISECVVNADEMMERICRELMITDGDLLKTDEEVKIELLREIAPAHLKQIEKRMVSELLYSELYKPGLDSHM